MGAPHLRNLAKKRGKNTQTEVMRGGGDCVWFPLLWQIPEVNSRNCGGLTSTCGLRCSELRFHGPLTLLLWLCGKKERWQKGYNGVEMDTL